MAGPIRAADATFSGDSPRPEGRPIACDPYPMLVSSMVSLGMPAARKITVEIPPELLQKAQSATGSGITQTVCTGLQLVAASQAYEKLRQLRGKVRFSRTAAELRGD